MSGTHEDWHGYKPGQVIVVSTGRRSGKSLYWLQELLKERLRELSANAEIQDTQDIAIVGSEPRGEGLMVIDELQVAQTGKQRDRPSRGKRKAAPGRWRNGQW